jgi:hypothetical protein
VAGPIAPVTALSVENCRFTDIGNGVWGVDLVGAAGVRVAGSTFRRATSATSARAVRVSVTSRSVVIESNDFTGLSTPAVTDSGSGTVLRNNRAG